MGENIKKRTHCDSPIKCWVSSDTAPLHPCDWLWLACGWERARGSAGQTRRVLQTGADAAIMLSAGALTQSNTEHVLRANGVWQMGHREQGWVGIMKPGEDKQRQCSEKKKWAAQKDADADGIRSDSWRLPLHDSLCFDVDSIVKKITCKTSCENLLKSK